MSSIITQARIKISLQCSAFNEKYNCQCKFPEGHEGNHEFTVIWEQNIIIPMKKKGEKMKKKTQFGKCKT